MRMGSTDLILNGSMMVRITNCSRQSEVEEDAGDPYHGVAGANCVY